MKIHDTLYILRKCMGGEDEYKNLYSLEEERYNEKS